MITNALNGVWSDTEIFQIIIHQKLQKVVKVLPKNLILSTLKKEKIEKRIPLELVFLVMKTRKNIQFTNRKKCCEEKHVDLSLVEEKRKKHYVLIKDFNRFMYNHILHRRKKHFCRYCLQAFTTEEMLKRHIKDCFKVNGKQRIAMPKKGKYVKFKNYERKIKSPFMIYVDFECILVPENNEKENRKESYTKNIKNILLAVMPIN